MIEKGFNYLIYEERTRLTYKIFCELVSDDTPGLCITTTYPEKIIKEHGLDKAKVVWLSERGGDKETLNPKRLDFEITRTISSFLKSGKSGVLLLDGLEYLVLENGFDTVRKFLRKINDLVSMNSCTFIVPVNPDSFSKENVTTLSKDFDRVEVASKLMTEGQKKICPQCGAAWMSNVILCGICGTRFEKEPAPAGIVITPDFPSGPSQTVSPSQEAKDSSPPQAQISTNPVARPQVVTVSSKPKASSTTSIPSQPTGPMKSAGPLSSSQDQESGTPSEHSSSGPSSTNQEIEIEDIYLIHRGTGALIQRRTWRRADAIDPDLVAGMFESVKNFINDSFVSGKHSDFSRMDIKDYTILVQDGEFVSLAIVLSGNTEKLDRNLTGMKNVLSKMLFDIEKKFYNILLTWDGNIDNLRSTRKNLDYLAAETNALFETGQVANVSPSFVPPSSSSTKTVPITTSGASPAGQSPAASSPPAVPRAGESASEWFSKGVQMERQGRSTDAIECYNKALEINPNDPRALFNKGVSLQILGKVQEALECYEKALLINPRDIELWCNKGIALRSLGRVEEAIKCYDRALALNPHDPGTLSNKGVALRSLGRIDEAIKCYDLAAEINPTDAGVWTNKGIALQSLGKLEEAIACYDKALTINPTKRIAMKNKEIALNELKKRGK